MAGAIAIPLGLLWWSDSTAVPSISQYSGPVASVSSDPKFGTHVALHGENGVSPDIFFDGVVLDVTVGDRATVWAENQAGGEWGLKFQSDRETWIDPAYGGDLTNPLPPYGLFSVLALGGGPALVLVGLAGAYRRIANGPVAIQMSAARIPAPTQAAATDLQPASVTGAPEGLALTPRPPNAGRAGTVAQIALALGGTTGLASLVLHGDCWQHFVALLMSLPTPAVFAVGAVFARSAASKARRAPGGDGRNWPAIATLAIALAAAGVAWIPVALFYYVFSCLG